MRITKFMKPAAAGMRSVCITITNGLFAVPAPVQGSTASISASVSRYSTISRTTVDRNARMIATSGCAASPAATAIISMLR